MTIDPQPQMVYVFQGSGLGSARVSGVFSSKNEAERWIAKHGLTGTLSEYAMNEPSYERGQRLGRWRPKKPEHHTAAFIEDFSPPDGHWHHRDGKEG